jgi:diaminopropionate ammonia-lyase
VGGERALREAPGTHTLVAASAGYHGRAVAHVARLRGLGARVFLPERSLLVRREAIASEGAEMAVVDGTYEESVAAAEAAATEPGALLISDVGDSGPAHWVINGYSTLFAEAASQARYDSLVVPVGVGALAAAAARHGAEVGVRVIGVEPEAAACLTASLGAGRPVAVETPGTTMAGLDCAEVSPAAWSDLSTGIHGTVTVSYAEAAAAMDELAAHGLAIGESDAAPLAGLRKLTFEGAVARVLLVATEGRTGAGAEPLDA